VVSSGDVVELPEILSGGHPGRTDERQRVFLSPVGLAVEDVAAAARVWRRAVDLGLGTPLDLWQRALWS
jgi:N-[(2S)-2-amino-2-carboxyethyl]-L-glutamate dehydrogenase